MSARFFVGQRVKKVRGKQNIGCEGVVMATGHFAAGFPKPGIYLTRDCDLCVQYATAWRNAGEVLMPASAYAYGLSDQYEPLYDGNEVVSWESMRELWVPSEVTV